MKKILSTFLVFVMILSLGTMYPMNKAEAGALTETRTDIGSYDIQRFNNLWGTPSENVVVLFTPGENMNGKYFNKICAQYNSEKNCYVVIKKVWNLRDMAENGAVRYDVPENCIGLGFNYNPLIALSNTRIREMWLTWQQVKVGDEIRLSDVDVANQTLGADPKANFTAVRTEEPTTQGFFSGKTIVALGDSITVGGGWTEQLEELLDCRVVNAGMGGDTAAGAVSSRFDMLVPQHNPDIVIISYGINDCLAARLEKPTLQHIADYKAKMKTLYDKATAIGAKVVFQNANNIKVKTYEDSHNLDGRFAEFGGVQGYLDLWEQSLKDLARELNVPLVDLYNMWRNEIPNDAEGIAEYLVDNVHPNDKGFDKNMEVIEEAWTKAIPNLLGWLDPETDCTAVLEDGVIKNIAEGTKVSTLLNMYINAENVVRNGSGLSSDAVLKTGDALVVRTDAGLYMVAIEVGNYTVSFAATEGGTISSTAPISLAYGTAVSSLTFPTPTANEGYRFARWRCTDSIVSGNMTIVAEFEQVTHTVTFVAGEGGVLMGQTVITVLDGTSFSALPFPETRPRAGYEFVRWDKSVTGTKVKSDVTLTAVFKKIEEEKEFILGDVDGDEKVNPFDASLILRLDAMLISEDSINMDAADVSGDDKVDPFDASIILRYDAMLIDKFPADK